MSFILRIVESYGKVLSRVRGELVWVLGEFFSSFAVEVIIVVFFSYR